MRCEICGKDIGKADTNPNLIGGQMAAHRRSKACQAVAAAQSPALSEVPVPIDEPATDAQAPVAAEIQMEVEPDSLDEDIEETPQSQHAWHDWEAACGHTMTEREWMGFQLRALAGALGQRVRRAMQGWMEDQRERASIEAASARFTSPRMTGTPLGSWERLVHDARVHQAGLDRTEPRYGRAVGFDASQLPDPDTLEAENERLGTPGALSVAKLAT